MASANRFFCNLGLPFLFLFYVAFLVFDFKNINHHNFHNLLIENKKKSIGMEQIDGVILGGSNAVYSLSASYMAKLTGKSWVNFSLLNEGYSDGNYWKFVSENFPVEKRLLVTSVVYSSASSQDRENILLRQKNNTNLIGVKRYSLLPHKTLFHYLRNLKDNPVFASADYVGDFNFDSECKLHQAIYRFNPNLDERVVKEWSMNQLHMLSALFPNATLYFVVPSSFYTGRIDEHLVLESDRLLRTAVAAFQKNTARSVFFIRQSNFPERGMLCDVNNHANQSGRMWRTLDLYEKIAGQSRCETGVE